MNVLDIFSGIGGFSLGLSRAGMRTVAFCERDRYARAVLEKHWPNVPIYHDVRRLTAARLQADGITADVICGGWPCQDLSIAGKGAGLAGNSSGLWTEFARLIREIRPRYALMENVSALRSRGLGTILGDLAAIRFSAEWHCIPASAFGAPHQRDRIWIIAYPDSAAVWITEQREARRRNDVQTFGETKPADNGAVGILADTNLARLPLSECQLVLGPRWWDERRAVAQCDWWAAEPSVDRVAYGLPRRVDRLRCLGNAVVPQVVEAIGTAIMLHARAHGHAA